MSLSFPKFGLILVGRGLALRRARRPALRIFNKIGTERLPHLRVKQVIAKQQNRHAGADDAVREKRKRYRE